MQKSQFFNPVHTFADGDEGLRKEEVMEAPATDAADAVGSGGGADAQSGRNGTRNEKHDRNWDDLLQELRVMQTGTRIIAVFC